MWRDKRLVLVFSVIHGLEKNTLIVEHLKHERTSHKSVLLKICVKTGASWPSQPFRQQCETPSGLRLSFCLWKHRSASFIDASHSLYSWNYKLCSEWLEAREMFCPFQCGIFFTEASFMLFAFFFLLQTTSLWPDFGCENIAAAVFKDSW